MSEQSISDTVRLLARMLMADHPEAARQMLAELTGELPPPPRRSKFHFAATPWSHEVEDPEPLPVPNGVEPVVVRRRLVRVGKSKPEPRPRLDKDALQARLAEWLDAQDQPVTIKVAMAALGYKDAPIRLAFDALVYKGQAKQVLAPELQTSGTKPAKMYLATHKPWVETLGIEALINARRAEPQPKPYLHAERDRAMFEQYYTDGQTLDSVGSAYGLTRERVRQIIDRQQAVRSHPSGLAEPYETKRQKVRAKREVEAKAQVEAKTKDCLICGQSFVGQGRACDNADCRYVYYTGRRIWDPERYASNRLSVARYALKHPEKNTPGSLAWAQRIVDGDAPPPRGRWLTKDSKLRAALVRVGRTDLIPNYDTPEAQAVREHHRCIATRRTDPPTPCLRWVTEPGSLCSVHTMEDVRLDPSKQTC